MVIDAILVTAQNCAIMATPPEKLLSSHTLLQMRPERIGRRLRVLREALELKPSEIADSLGIERTYWSRFENGKRALTDAHGALICERYGVTMDYLIRGEWAHLPLTLAAKMREVDRRISDQETIP
ncbi:helix-turn-helix domain-containing protein [Paracoccus sp. NGMCC 1.201697]|uniref:Helix-turn-helix domain-containing protein n=1 Tax=Paracoccus broussonetiae subsp. drimophilus TaxID=3373869 RepID=A0ABW7LIE8_9RHOB